MAIKRFLADAAGGDMAVSSGLTATPIDRDGVETVDPLGDVVADDEPRFDETVLIAAVPSYGNALGSTNSGLLLASGVDQNGTSPLLLYLNTSSSPPRLDMYLGTETTPTHQTALTQFTVGSNSTATNGSTFYGFPGGTPTEAIQPRTAVIFHGAIIVGGPVWLRQSNGTYELSGWGFAINQNSGNSANWSLVWHDTSLAQGQLYLPRGREWCMRACPAYQRGQTNPTSCFITCADYIYKYDGDESLNAHSGNAFVLRITRPNSSTAWTVGAGTANTVMRFDIRPASTQFSGLTFRKLNHVHACVLTEWTPPSTQGETLGIQVVVPTGDSQPRNRFLRFILADITQDYTLTSNWTPQENYHGKADPESGTAEATESSQPGCGFFGPEPGTIVWTTDLNVEWLNLMRLPDGDATLDQATFEHVYGLATGFGRDNTGDPNQYNPTRSRPVFQGLSQPRPELEEHSLAVAYDEAAIAGYEEDARRVLYCPDVTNIRQWVQYGPIPANTPTVAIHAGYMYISANQYGIRRALLPQFPSDLVETPPTMIAIRPMLIGPGGKNLVREKVSGFDSGCYLNKVHATAFDAMSRDTGTPPLWKDGSKELPKIPAVAETGIKIRTRRANDSSSHAGNVRVSSNSGSSWNQLPSGFAWATGATPQVRRFRGWVLDGSDGQTSSITPNKTNQLLVRLWDEAGGVTSGGAVSLYSCHKQWCPVTNISVETLVAGTGLGLRVNSHVAHDDGAKDDNYGYFVISEALDGNGSLPYPLPPETDGPDEHLTIDGLPGSSGSWSLKLAGMMPRANWDHYAARETTAGSGVSDRRWPLFTLWKDNDHWLEFSADCEDKGFLVRYKNGSGDPEEAPFGDAHQVWLPDSPLFVGISYNSQDQKLYVGASLAGSPVHVIASGLTASSAPGYTHLRFRGAPGGGYSGGGEVCEFRWIGGEINDAQALNNTSLLSAFADLAFLEGP